MRPSDIPPLLRAFRNRTKLIRGLPFPPNDDIGVSLVIADCGDAKIVAELQGVPMSMPPEERILEIASRSAPTHATAYFFSADDAISFLRGEGEADWILSDEETR